MTKARLLLVDDHQILRAGLRALFERQEDVEVVGEAASAPEAIALVRSSRPTIVLLDLTLPDGGGMAVLQALKAGDVPCRALVLTMHDDPAYAARA